MSSKFFGYHNAFKIYTWKNVKKVILWPFILSIVIFPFIVLSENESLFFVIKISDLIITLFPPLLGFSLGGYALIVGFTTPEFLEFITGQNPTSVTIFQKVNGTFAVSILFQAMILLLGFIISLLASCEFDSLYADYVNYFITYLLLFVLIWGIFTIKDMIINIFNFGQLRHYEQWKKMIQDKRNNS